MTDRERQAVLQSLVTEVEDQMNRQVAKVKALTADGASVSVKARAAHNFGAGAYYAACLDLLSGLLKDDDPDKTEFLLFGPSGGRVLMDTAWNGTMTQTLESDKGKAMFNFPGPMLSGFTRGAVEAETHMSEMLEVMCGKQSIGYDDEAYEERMGPPVPANMAAVVEQAIQTGEAPDFIEDPEVRDKVADILKVIRKARGGEN